MYAARKMSVSVLPSCLKDSRAPHYVVSLLSREGPLVTSDLDKLASCDSPQSNLGAGCGPHLLRNVLLDLGIPPT